MRRLPTIALFVTLTLTVACSNYNVSVNDRVVYTPLPLFAGYHLNDSNLATCVEQTIADNKITAARDLTRLRCTSAGIKDLTGLEKFYNLEQLDLSDNALSDVGPVARLGQLEMLLLRNNQLGDLSPLLSLVKLTELNIEENPDVSCSDLTQIRANLKDNYGRVVADNVCQN